MEAFLIIVIVAAAAWAGWRVCRYITNRKMVEENIFLRNHVEALKETNQYWKDQSSYNSHIQQTTITNHQSNLENEISTIVTILENLKKDEQETMKQEDKRKVSNLIERIKGISS